MGKINGVTAHETTVGECRQYVDRRVPFHTTNKQLFGYWAPSGVYAVFSYGQHWPLFVYEPKTTSWFANEDKYGTTTSKHYGKAHPFATPTTKLSCTAMKKLVAVGYTALVEWRLVSGEALKGEAA
jgi:hypothetical protein